jgi:hypothetical protein
MYSTVLLLKGGDTRKKGMKEVTNSKIGFIVRFMDPSNS